MSYLPTSRDDPQRYQPAANDAADALAWLIGNSQQRCYLQLPQLDHLLIGPAVVAALKTLALSSAHRDIRILLDDPALAIQQGHPLVHLARRLPSRLLIRHTGEEDRDPLRCHAIADRRCLLQLAGWPRAQSLSLCARDLPLAPRLADAFIQRWERASSSAELRELRL